MREKQCEEGTAGTGDGDLLDPVLDLKQDQEACKVVKTVVPAQTLARAEVSEGDGKVKAESIVEGKEEEERDSKVRRLPIILTPLG